MSEGFIPRSKLVNKTEDENNSAVRVYCKYCGHTNSIPAYVDRKICHWCNRIILNDTKVHFNRKLRELMKERNKDGRETKGVNQEDSRPTNE